MYEDYFGLSGPAFRLNPDPKFYFGSRTHNKAMSYLHYGLKQGEGFIVLTGEEGAGKTLLASRLVEQARFSGVTAALLSAANTDPDELLPQVLAAFGIEGPFAQADMLDALERFSFDELRRGRRVLLVVDEAQNHSVETLEQIRILSNLNYDGTPLLQVFLAGGVALEEKLRAPALAGLRRRVIAFYRLEALTREETREYILHRLSAVGWREDPVFSDDAMASIFDETCGAPVRVNSVCNRIMLYCAVERRHEATADIVEAVLQEMRAEGGDDASSIDDVGAAQISDVAAALEDAARFEEAAQAEQSEFDRLIGPRRAEADDRHEATLSDVASAIAAAANGDIANLPGEDAPPSRGAALGDLRKALLDAEERIAGLRRAAEARRRSAEDREAAFASALSRADALIAQLRGADRQASSSDGGV